MSNAHAIFISYRRSDSNDVTGRIYDRLVNAFGTTAVFKDVHSIPYGVSFPTYIQQELAKCQVLLAIIGPTWLTVERHGQRRLEDPADWVRVEVQSALELEGITVIPLLVGGAERPTADQLPEALKPLASLNNAQARPDPDFHIDMNRLVKRLEALLEPAGSKDIARQPSDSRRSFYKRQKALLEEELAAVESDLEIAPREVDRMRLGKEAERLLRKIDELDNRLNR